MLQMTTFIDKREVFDTETHVGNELLNTLGLIISDVPDPIFIAEKRSGTVVLVNEFALERLFGLDPVGLQLHDVLGRDLPPGNRSSIYFSNRWYTLDIRSFTLNKKSYLKIRLKEKAGLPGAESLKSMQNMISVLLHRFRSPLTGMMGFVDILTLDHRNTRSEKHLSNLENGIDYLYEMLDELEYFLNLDSLSRTSDFDPAELVDEILNSFHGQDKDRVKILNQDHQTLSSCKIKVGKILSLLIDNAIRHSGNHPDITVSVDSSSSVHITNHGYSISEEDKEWIFQPFTTTAADRMGNGLTIAQILSANIGASIDLKTDEKSTTFILMLPPNKKGPNVN